MAWNKEDRSFKILIGKKVTSSAKAYYSEFGAPTLDLQLQNIKTQNIPYNDPVAAMTAQIAQPYNLFDLYEDITVRDQQAYYAADITEGGGEIFLGDWISDQNGADYSVSLFEADGTPIYPADPCDWFFDYPTGVLTFGASTASKTKPFKITGYRYVGAKGIIVGNKLDIYNVPSALRAAVVQGTYNASNELVPEDAFAPGSLAGMRFSYGYHTYEYMPGDAGSLVWVRTKKKGSSGGSSVSVVQTLVDPSTTSVPSVDAVRNALPVVEQDLSSGSGSSVPSVYAVANVLNANGAAIFSDSKALVVQNAGQTLPGIRGRWDRPFLTMQDAVDNAQAGDTLYVMPSGGSGEITDSVSINKSLTVVGLGKPVFSGYLEAGGYTTRYLNGLNITIRGFEYRTRIVVIKPSFGSNTVTFEDCSFTTEGYLQIFGLQIYNPENGTTTMRRCTFETTSGTSSIIFTERNDGEQSSRLVLEDCRFRSETAAMLAGTLGSTTRVLLRHTTSFTAVSGQSPYSLTRINSTVQLPENEFLTDERSGDGVAHRSSTTLTFERNAEYDPISTGSFTVDDDTKVIGAVVSAYLTPGSSAPSIPAIGYSTNDAYAPNKYLMYMFKVGASGVIHYTISEYIKNEPA